MSFTAVSFGHCWRRLVFAVFLGQVMISVDGFIRLETCIHGWWSCRLFLLLADGFSCHLIWDDILTRVFRWLHCLLTMTFACFRLSLAFFVGVACLCVCGRLTERSLGRVLPIYLFWLWKFLLHPMGVRSFGPSDVLTWSLLSLRRLLVCLLHVEFQRLRGGLLASPLSSWLRSVRLFFISHLLVEDDCICQGVFLISHFLLILAGVLWG